MLDHNSLSQQMRKKEQMRKKVLRERKLVNRQMMIGKNITTHKNLYRSDNIMKHSIRVQARGRLRRNTRPDGVNFALEGSGGEKTSPDICSFCKKSLLVLPVMLKTKCKIFVTNGHEIFR